jgi:hypothetical protein
MYKSFNGSFPTVEAEFLPIFTPLKSHKAVRPWNYYGRRSLKLKKFSVEPFLTVARSKPIGYETELLFELCGQCKDYRPPAAELGRRRRKKYRRRKAAGQISVSRISAKIKNWAAAEFSPPISAATLLVDFWYILHRFSSASRVHDTDDT